uniref:Kininogen-1 n=1 Tax=Lygus hesperus TaxID=30085 RepID=A0A0A9WZ70_LYGHE
MHSCRKRKKKINLFFRKLKKKRNSKKINIGVLHDRNHVHGRDHAHAHGRDRGHVHGRRKDDQDHGHVVHNKNGVDGDDKDDHADELDSGGGADPAADQDPNLRRRKKEWRINSGSMRNRRRHKGNRNPKQTTYHRQGGRPSPHPTIREDSLSTRKAGAANEEEGNDPNSGQREDT